MKKIIKYGLVGLGGYLIRAYEMKYKTIKILEKYRVEKESKESESST